MATEPVSKPSRAPWIIAGVLGCLLLCLIVTVVGIGAFSLFGRAPTPTPIVRVVPTVPPAIVPTLPLIVVPTLLPAQPTRPLSPTLPAAQPTLPPLPTVSTPRPTVVPSPVRPAAPTGKIAFSKVEGTGDLPEQKSVWTMNADGTNARPLFDRASDPSFSPDGTRIAFYHWTDGMFIANLQDAPSARKYVGDTKARSPAWSHDGKWVAFTGMDVVPSSVLVGETPLRRGIVIGAMPSWSPDDTQIAFQTCRENTCGLYKVNFAGGDATLLVGDDGSLPSWSPDGKKILYQKEVDGERQLFVINPDGSGKKQLTIGPAMHVAATWSLDGNFIVYRSPEEGTWAIWRMNADGTNRVKLIDNAPPVDWAFERLAVSK